MIQLRLTLGGFWFFGFFICLFFVSLITSNNILFFINSFFISSFFVSVTFSALDLKRISVKISRKQASAKSLGFDQIVVVNKKKSSLFGIKIQEYYADGRVLTLGKIPFMKRAESMTLNSEYFFETRGEILSKGTFMSSNYPLGLFNLSKRLEGRSRRVVWPERLAKKGFGADQATGAQKKTTGKDERSHTSDGELRSYTPEDDCRTIVWKLSNRGAGFVVRPKTVEPEISPFCLDLRASSYSSLVDFENKVIEVSSAFYKMKGFSKNQGTLTFLTDSQKEKIQLTGWHNILNKLAVVRMDDGLSKHTEPIS